MAPTQIAQHMGITRRTVYNIKKRLDADEDLEQKSGRGRKCLLQLDAVKETLEADPLKSIRANAADMGVSEWTIRKAVKDAGGNSLVCTGRPLSTPKIQAEHLQRCHLINDLKSARAGIIISDEKTWTVDPVHNRQNGRCLSFSVVDEAVRTLQTTKHPAFVMSLGFVSSNGMVAPLIWFPAGCKLTAADYIDMLETKFLPWAKAAFPDGNFVLQQDGAPAHTTKRKQEFLRANVEFWSKEKWPPYSPDANPLDYAFWPHVQARVCRVRYPNVEALKQAIDAEWNTMDANYVRKVCA